MNCLINYGNLAYTIQSHPKKMGEHGIIPYAPITI